MFHLKFTPDMCVSFKSKILNVSLPPPRPVKISHKQESIPVGCIPSAAVAVGGCLLGGRGCGQNDIRL